MRSTLSSLMSIELGIFAALPAATDNLAAKLSICRAATAALLGVLAAMNFVETDCDGDGWELTSTGRAFLLPGSSAFAGPYLCSSAVNKPAHERLRSRLLAPAPAPGTTLRAWEAGTFDGDLHRAEACVVHMHALHAPTALRAARTLARVICERCGSASEGSSSGRGGGSSGSVLRVLDAGGGSGVFSVCLAKASTQDEHPG